MPISTYHANRILNYEFGLTSYSPPSTYYLGFCTSLLITSSWNGTILMSYEPRPVGADPETNYNRIAISNDKLNWTISTGNAIENLNVILSPRAFVNWDTIYAIFIADAYTNGNMLYYQILNVPLNVLAGESVMFYPSDINIETGWNMNNTKIFLLETDSDSDNFTIRYPNILQKDLESNFNTSFNMIIDDVVPIKLSNDLFQDGEYLILFDFFFTITANRVAPTLLNEMDGFYLSSFDSKILFDVDYTIQP